MSFNDTFQHLLSTTTLLSLNKPQKSRFNLAKNASLRIILRSLILNMINDRLSASVAPQNESFELFKDKSTVILESQNLTMALPAHLHPLTAVVHSPKLPNSRASSSDSSAIIPDGRYFTPTKTLVTDILDNSKFRHDLARHKPLYSSAKSENSTVSHLEKQIPILEPKIPGAKQQIPHVLNAGYDFQVATDGSSDTLNIPGHKNPRRGFSHVRSDPETPIPNSENTSEDSVYTSPIPFIPIASTTKQTPKQIPQKKELVLNLELKIYTRHRVTKNGNNERPSFWAYVNLQTSVVDKRGNMRVVQVEVGCKVVDQESLSLLGILTPGWADIVRCLKKKIEEYGPDSNKLKRISLKWKKVVRWNKRERDSKGKYKVLKEGRKTRK